DGTPGMMSVGGITADRYVSGDCPHPPTVAAAPEAAMILKKDRRSMGFIAPFCSCVPRGRSHTQHVSPPVSHARPHRRPVESDIRLHRDAGAPRMKKRTETPYSRASTL